MRFDEIEDHEDVSAERPVGEDERLANGENPQPLCSPGSAPQVDGLTDDDSFLLFLDRNWPRNRSTDEAGVASGPSGESSVGVDEVPSVGRFQIHRQLGKGGFGTVYLAHDRLLGHDVAIKIPHPETRRSEQLLRRFEREARAAASLDHPNINPIYETGKLASDLYISSHYCPGPTLAEWLKHHLAPVSSESVASLIAMLASAVQHAHERGILHRDLKPSNVLLDPVNNPQVAGATETRFEGFIPRLCDFGLAKILNENSEDTRTGLVVGTPRYMAPEQAAGKVSEIGPTTDVYALGVILYELLIGRPPFAGDTDLETLRQIRSEQPLSVRRLQPKVPRDLDTICMKCLEKEPARRYASARDLNADLKCFLDHSPIRARPVTLARRIRLWTRRHPAQSVVLIAGLMIFLGLPAGLIWHALGLEQAFRIAEHQRIRAEEFGAQARANEVTVQQHVYSSEMRLANQLLKVGEFKAMSRLVDRHDPRRVGGADRRGFEWWHLHRYHDIEQLGWQPHAGALNLLAFSDDGQVLMSASYADQCAKTWQLASGKLLATLPTRKWREPHDREVGAISPDGKTAATLIDTRSVAVWDAMTGDEKVRLTHEGEIICVAFSPDGRFLLTGGDDGTKLWSYGSWEAPNVVMGAARRAVFSPDSTTLATVWAPSFSSEVQFYDLRVRKFKPPIKTWWPVQEIAYTRDGGMLAVVFDGPNGTGIDIHNSDTGALLHQVTRHSTQLRGVAFSADGRLLASAAQDGSLDFWETESGQTRGSFRGTGKRILQFAFSPDGRSLATSMNDGSVSVWDRTLLGGPEPLKVSAASYGPVVFNPSRSQVAVVNKDRSVMLINAKTRRLEVRLEGSFDRVADIAFSSDGQRLATVDGRHIRCWDANNGRQLWRTEGLGVRSIDWSPVAQTLATGGSDHCVRLWDAETGMEVGLLKAHSDDVRMVRFFADGKRLASASFDTTVRIWDVAEKNDARAPLLHNSAVYDLAISKDGRALAAGQSIGTSILWKLTDGIPPERSEAPWFAGSIAWFASPPSGPIFSSDGGILGTLGPGGIFRAERPATRELLYALSGRGVDPTSVAISPDGRILASVSKSNELTFWDTSTWTGQRVFGAPLSAVRTLAFSADSKTLAVGSDNSPDVEPPGFGNFPATPNLRVPGSQDNFAPSKLPARTCDYVPWQVTTDSLRFWDVPSGVEQSPLDSIPTLTMLPSVAWSQGSNTLVAASRDGSLWAWDMVRHEIVARLFLDDRVRNSIEAAKSNSPALVPQSALAPHAVAPLLALSPSGSRLATVDREGVVKLRNTGNWQELVTLPGEHADPRCLVFSQDGRSLVVNHRGQARFYDAQSGRLRFAVGSQSAPAILCSQFSPDGRVLALGTIDGNVRCFDVANRTLTTTLVGHVDAVASLAFAPNGKTLATGSWDTIVRLWDVTSGREVASLEGHRGRVHAVAFSPDGSVLASGGEIADGLGELYLWRTAGGSQDIVGNSNPK